MKSALHPLQLAFALQVPAHASTVYYFHVSLQAAGCLACHRMACQTHQAHASRMQAYQSRVHKSQHMLWKPHKAILNST